MNTSTKQTGYMDASKQTAAFGGGYFKTLLTLFILFLSAGVWGQTTYDWLNTAPDGNWKQGAGGAARWNPGGLWDQPTSSSATRLRFNNNNFTTMTNNVTAGYVIGQLFFGSSATTSRTIGGNSVQFFEFSSTWPRIENQSTTLHTINFPFIASSNSGFNMELVASSGSIDFGLSSTVNNNGRTVQIYGNNSAIDVTNRAIRLGGVVSGTGILNVSQSGVVKLNATHTYSGETQIDNGELWIESSGSIAAGSNVFLGNGGQTGNIAKIWISASGGGTTFSKAITVNNGNSTTRYLGGLNTTGTHTFSGNIANNSTTGGLYLSALESGGNTSFSGIISGSGALLVDGAGTVILSGSNTYTGGTRILSGTLSASSAGNFGNTSGAITLGNSSTTGTLNITTSLTRTDLNVTDTSSAGVINVATSQIFTLTNLNIASGTNNTTKIGKSGAGTLTLSGAGSYVGQTQIGEGTVIVSNNAGLGTNNSTTARGIDLGLNVGDVSQANNVSVLATNGVTVPQSIYVAPNTSSATRTIGLSGGSGTATFNNEIYLDGNLTVSGTGTVVLSGRLTNTGGVISNATTINLQHNANNYSGTTTINSGSELRLNPSSNATFASQIALNGGTLGTIGIAAARTWTSSSTLNVTANSTIALLASTAHTLTFAASSAVSWTVATTLTITGWSGNYDGTAGTGGRIFFGNSAGLTATQLAQITFYNPSNNSNFKAELLSTGELVPKANTWTGAISTSWNNAGNWSLSRVPLATDNIVISSGTPVLDVSHTINSGTKLTLSGTGTLTINPNAILTITGTADFGGKSVTLKSDSSGTAAIGQVTGTLSNATNVTVERYIPSKRAWRALTAPLKGSTNNSIFYNWQNNGTTTSGVGVELWGPGGTGSAGNGLASGAGASIKQYGNGWTDVINTKTTSLFTTDGNNAYMVFVTGGYGSGNISSGFADTTLKATGELRTGDVTYTGLSSTFHTLIGNPYASPISPSLILANTDNAAVLFPYLWVWDPKLNDFGGYVLYDNGFATYSGGSYSANTAIQSGQAFFVRTEAVTGNVLKLKESMKSSNVSPTFRNSNTAMASIFRVGFLKQTATDWMPLDGCIAGFYEGANAAADDADGKKMINSGENIGFVRNAVNLSSEHYPLVTNQDILNLKIWNTQQARYKLKLNTEEFTMVGVEAYLQDLYTGTTQPLNLDGSVQEYEFDVDPTVSASSGNRFRIVFTNIGLAVTNPEQGQLSIYPNPATGGKVTVSLPTGNFEGCSYELINVLGQVVRQDQITNSNSSQVSIPLSGLPNSWYALRIRKDNKIMYQGKLIINN